jgi:hypothetical protein
MTPTTLTAWIAAHGDDQAYLVPTLPTAPRAAYALPRCTVVAINGVRVTVRIDGQEIETDISNVRRTRPRVDAPKVKSPRRRSMPDGYAEVTLW